MENTPLQSDSENFYFVLCPGCNDGEGVKDVGTHECIKGGACHCPVCNDWVAEHLFRSFGKDPKDIPCDFAERWVNYAKNIPKEEVLSGEYRPGRVLKGPEEDG